MLTKLTVDTAFIAELTDHPVHEKMRPKQVQTHPMAIHQKKLLCDDGEIELNTPHDRKNTFEPRLIKKHQTRITPDFIPKCQSLDCPRNRRHLQRDVRHGCVTHADIKDHRRRQSPSEWERNQQSYFPGAGGRAERVTEYVTGRK